MSSLPQTKCKWGHRLTNPKNVYIRADGKRGCRACALRRSAEQRARAKKRKKEELRQSAA